MYKKGLTKQYLHLDAKLCSHLLLDLYTPIAVKQVHCEMQGSDWHPESETRKWISARTLPADH